MTLTHFSLFTGIGGIDLAAEWAGFEMVGQCEFADYPTKVLEKHWPDVPRWRDIRNVTAESVRSRGIADVTLLSGGFPCQPFSVAGNQKGKGDDRYLWPEMCRVIRELKPRWVIGENVPGILSIAADDVCTDLEREGYEVGIFDYEAAAVGAKHRRERIFFVGYSKHNGLFTTKIEGIIDSSSYYNTKRENATGKFEGASESRSYEDVPDTYNERLQITGPQSTINAIPKSNRIEFRDWWSIEPSMGRVANGIPNRVDRLKCLGNAVVPQQVYPILQAIADIERG